MIGHSHSPPRSAQRGRLLRMRKKEKRRGKNQLPILPLEKKRKSSHHPPLLILVGKTRQNRGQDPRCVGQHCRACQVDKLPGNWFVMSGNVTVSKRFTPLQGESIPNPCNCRLLKRYMRVLTVPEKASQVKFPLFLTFLTLSGFRSCRRSRLGQVDR